MNKSCMNCWGTGKVPDFWDNDKEVICPHCGGTSIETPMTNEEWFCQLPTKEKAEVFIEICRDAFRAEEYRRNHWSDLQTIEYWERWLKQPHSEVGK